MLVTAYMQYEMLFQNSGNGVLKRFALQNLEYVMIKIPFGKHGKCFSTVFFSVASNVLNTKIQYLIVNTR